jgi:hypothetical protein
MQAKAGKSQQKPANDTISWCPNAGTNKDKPPTPSGQGYLTG